MERRNSLENFFKFQVLNPFTLEKAIFTTQNGFALSLDVCNKTASSIFIDSVTLTPETGFTVIDLNPGSNFNPALPLCLDPESLVYIKPNSIRQFLFKLDYENIEDPLSRNYTNLGVITVIWKSTLGEEGSYTEQIPQSVAFRNDISLVVTDIPKNICLEEPFTINFKIINKGKTAVTPMLDIDQSVSNVKITGISNQRGKMLIPSGETETVQLSMFPLFPGLQYINGIRVCDKETGKVFEFDHVLTIFVDQKAPNLI